MANYQRIFASSSDQDSDEKREEDLSPKQRCCGGSKCPGLLTLGVQLYVALLATLICILQVSFHSGASCTPKAPVASAEEGYVQTTYSRDFRYMSLHHRYDDLWEYGNSSTLRVPEPELGTNEDVDAMISMYHQLHCLSSLRHALQTAYEGGEIALDQRGDAHWPHCLDYLRETILCYGDGTLELPRIVDGKRANFIDGVQDLRKCRPTKDLFSQHPDYVHNT